MSPQADYTFKILLLGDSAVGKTSLAKRFVHDTFSREYLMSIGMEPYQKYIDIKPTGSRTYNVCLSIFDIAGEKSFRKLREMFYRGAKATVLVFDLTREPTFNNIEKWKIESFNKSNNQEFILIGNKSDLDTDRVVKSSFGRNLAKSLNCITYIETSALTGDHVNEAFTKIGKSLLQKELERKTDANTAQVNKH